MATLLWLDDMRDPKYHALPFNGEIVWVKTYQEFDAWIKVNGLPEKISFDYSLGNYDYDGISCVKSVLRYCDKNTLHFPRYAIHSEHPHVYKLREYIEFSILHYELGPAEEEDRKPDTDDQKAVNAQRKLESSSTMRTMLTGDTHINNHTNVSSKTQVIVTTNTIKNKPKIGRNEVCSCTSGKKYKHCCGKSNN